MAEIELIRCEHCGGDLSGAKKETEFLIICPYCGGKNYVSPSYDYYENLLADFLNNPEKTAQISMKIGELEADISKALDDERFQDALKLKGEVILLYQGMMPGVKSEEDKQNFFELEMHRFKKEKFTEKGKKLKQEYDQAILDGDLDTAVRKQLELEFYKLEDCNLGFKYLSRVKKGLIDSARYFAKGFYSGTDQEKQAVIKKFGLDKGLLKVGSKFRCPACGGEIDVSQSENITQCPFCDNVFQESGLDKLSDNMKQDPNKTFGDEEQQKKLLEAYQKELDDKKKATDEKPESMRVKMSIPCPYCGEEIVINDPENVVCPNCGKKLS